MKEGDNERHLTSLKARNFQLYPPPPMAQDQEKLKTWFDVFNREYQQPIKSILQTALHFKFGKFFSGKESELEAKGVSLCKNCGSHVLFHEDSDTFQEDLDWLNTFIKKQNEFDITAFRKISSLKEWAKEMNLQSFKVYDNGESKAIKKNQNTSMFFKQSKELTERYSQITVDDVYISEVSYNNLGGVLVHTLDLFHSYYQSKEYWVTAEVGLEDFLIENSIEKFEFEIEKLDYNITVNVRFFHTLHYPFGNFSLPYSFTIRVDDELLKTDWPNLSLSQLVVKNISLPNGETASVIGIKA